MSEAGKAWGLIAALFAVGAFACLAAYTAGVQTGEARVAPPPAPLASLDLPPMSPRQALCADFMDRARDVLIDEDQAAAEAESAGQLGGSPAEGR